MGEAIVAVRRRRAYFFWRAMEVKIGNGTSTKPGTSSKDCLGMNTVHSPKIRLQRRTCKSTTRSDGTAVPEAKNGMAALHNAPRGTLLGRELLLPHPR